MSKLGETGLQKLQNGESFFGENPLKIAHGLNFTPKIIPGIRTHLAVHFSFIVVLEPFQPAAATPLVRQTM